MESVPTPPDVDFKYIGFTDRQIATLRDQPNYMRQLVYDEGLRMLMETTPGHEEYRTIAY